MATKKKRKPVTHVSIKDNCFEERPLHPQAEAKKVIGNNINVESSHFIVDGGQRMAAILEIARGLHSCARALESPLNTGPMLSIHGGNVEPNREASTINIGGRVEAKL